MTPLTDDEFDELFSTFRRSAFRLETLPVYDVEEEAYALAAYLSGQPLPPNPRSGWVEFVEQATLAGKTMERVRILTPPIQSYFGFELEWAYLYNASAGEQIYILRNQNPQKTFSSLPFRDFWLFDDQVVVEMEYDSIGRYLSASKASPSEVVSYQSLRDKSRSAAIPLSQYLAEVRAHPLPLLSA